MIDFRPVFFIVGVLSSTFGPLLLICALVDLGAGHRDWQTFVMVAMLVMGFGSLLATANWGAPLKLSLRQGFMLTVISWVVLSLIGALPLYFSEYDISFTDAVFEAVSGVTTTGSTVLTGLDDMAPGLLLWRATLNWVGGLGVIAMGIVLLPFLRISGMQLFKMESSDVGNKATARVVVMVRQIALLYIGCTAVSIMLLTMGGVSFLDAVCHSFAAIATGGLSTHDASIGWFDSRYVEGVLMVGMLVGSLTFPLMIQAFHGRPQLLFDDPQVKFYLKLIVVVVFIISAWRVIATEAGLVDIVWGTSFNVISIISTTGFASENYLAWGHFPEAMFLMITLVGGCTGSTSGGIKAFRIYMLLKVMQNQLLTRLQPHRVLLVTYGERTIDDDVLRSIGAFVWMTLMVIVLFTPVISATGVDFVTALSSVMQAIANVGPGIGAQIGPAGNYAGLSDVAKWVLAFLMLLGRLEIVVVLVVLTPAYWSR
ncbi:TrkH family potassium uptake protein [Methylobrevis albus]|uniref:Trk system potassium uptake protein n=1 Tax=Methylobrevis albus TaxID=2793297 RepID=A0A931I2V2_9HYPH|nr:TrkH family potassium uptake protein [Methylobrevis albus]MBH0238278.1 TrkH family potassium uptake protein [Methylobrevis albus]